MFSKTFIEELTKELVYNAFGPTYWIRLTDAGRQHYLVRTEKALKIAQEMCDA